MDTTRLILVDDHAVVRAGIRHILQTAPDIQIVGEACDGAEAIAMVDALHPDVLLLDVEMPVLNGTEVARWLQEAKSPVKVLALSAYDDKHYVQELLRNGVDGYLTKDEAPSYIIEAVRRVARGEQGWISRRVAAQIAAIKRGEESPKEKAVRDLTKRQADVLRLVAAGRTNGEIAAELLISEKAVEKHLVLIFAKLGVVSRVEAAVQGLQRGLI
jgi:DNA-binding NarL/FixJ family response regulator